MFSRLFVPAKRAEKLEVPETSPAKVEVVKPQSAKKLVIVRKAEDSDESVGGDESEAEEEHEFPILTKYLNAKEKMSLISGLTEEPVRARIKELFNQVKIRYYKLPKRLPDTPGLYLNMQGEYLLIREATIIGDFTETSDGFEIFS